MPWEKQFDVNATLAKAMDMFWEQGYEATSMEDLVVCMGIHRGSIYATYGDKRSLFIQTLRHYTTERMQSWLTSLKTHESPRQSLLLLFEKALTSAFCAEGCRGCFLVNTALELSPHDPEIAQIVAAGLTDMEHFFREQIKKGQRLGEIRADINPLRVARSLLALLTGLQVLSRSRPEKALLQSIADQAAALLD